MNSLIQKLVQTGDIKRYLDFRTGSIKDFSSFEAATSIGGTDLRWSNNNGNGIFSLSTANHISISPVGLQPSDSGMLILCLMGGFGNLTTSGSSSFFTRTTTGINRLQVYYNNATTNILCYDGTTIGSMIGAESLKTWKEGCHTLGCVLGGSAKWYRDGISVSGSGTLAYTGDPDDLLLAVATPENAVMQAYIFVDKAAVSDADIARLHRELTAGPTVIHRPTKHFSIPYPSKTPAEYAAENITLDLNPSVSVSVSQDYLGNVLTHGNNDGETTYDGPFTTTQNAYTAETTSIGVSVELPASWSVSNTSLSCWVKSLFYSGIIIAAGLTNGFVVYIYKNANIIYVQTSSTTAGYARYNLGAISDLIHITVCIDNDTIPAVFINSVQVLPYIYTAYHSIIPSTLLVLGNRGGAASTIGGSYTCASARVWSKELTPAEVRAEYLLGARKCLLDARVHSDGSCPVSLAAVGAPNEIANGWKVNSGSWKVVEDAPVNGKPGQRYLKAQGTSTVYHNDESAYGAWLIELEQFSTGTFPTVNFIADRIGGYNSPIGYRLTIFTNGRMQLQRTTSVGASLIIDTADNTLLPNIKYKFWITRRFDGLFSVWVRGGIYTIWTLLGSGTDTTYTTNKYCVLYMLTSDKSNGVTHYMGEIQIDEAIKLGLVKE